VLASKADYEGNERTVWRRREMIRTAVAGTFGFVLVFVESFIVMKLKGYGTIEFGGITPFINIWAMNFFLVFSNLTQLTMWHDNRAAIEESDEENTY
jgi:hypothetical protein